MEPVRWQCCEEEGQEIKEDWQFCRWSGKLTVFLNE